MRDSGAGFRVEIGRGGLLDELAEDGVVELLPPAGEVFGLGFGGDRVRVGDAELCGGLGVVVRADGAAG